ncbi:DUF7309 domain-containing protein [Clostridium grantii]|uniref:Uncharacterized protein n=1 Tax=Clostridium grantii DSM 8605 TaxID=1121316 RepID=A0A1M5X6A8_9CLOT|nr:hypothetical protein [Clostridium grantii]SHH95316.1 hypothetical protein SAMN02745207_03383 [Clostridium grantii DSM 8605]
MNNKNINKDINNNFEELFQKAKEFNEVKPWQWLGGTDVFGIKLHDMDEIVFCSVMGMGEELYGMAIYKGIRGIESYFKMLDRDYDLDEEAIHIQQAITIDFVDRNEVTSQDYELIKDSGIKFRGKKQWPILREYEPGFIPWFAEEENLILMGRILDKAKDYVLYLKDNMDKAALMQEGKCHVREFYEDNSFKEKVVDYIKLNEEYDSLIEIPIVYDDLSIRRIKKQCKKTNVVLEIDAFYDLMPVEEEDQVPYFHGILMIVDVDEEYIIGNHITHPYNMAEEFQRYLLEFFNEKNELPRKVLISNFNLLTWVEDMFDKLGVQVEFVDHLSLIPEIKKEVLDEMFEE